MGPIPSSVPYVLRESGDILAVFKPSHYLVHPVGDHTAPDLMAWLAASDYPHAQPVHRLDLGVSGVLLCALTKTAALNLENNWRLKGLARSIGPLSEGLRERKGSFADLSKMRGARNLYLRRHATRDWKVSRQITPS